MLASLFLASLLVAITTIIHIAGISLVAMLITGAIDIRSSGHKRPVKWFC